MRLAQVRRRKSAAQVRAANSLRRFAPAALEQRLEAEAVPVGAEAPDGLPRLV